MPALSCSFSTRRLLSPERPGRGRPAVLGWARITGSGFRIHRHAAGHHRLGQRVHHGRGDDGRGSGVRRAAARICGFVARYRCGDRDLRGAGAIDARYPQSGCCRSGDQLRQRGQSRAVLLGRRVMAGCRGAVPLDKRDTSRDRCGRSHSGCRVWVWISAGDQPSSTVAVDGHVAAASVPLPVGRWRGSTGAIWRPLGTAGAAFAAVVLRAVQ